MKSLVISRTNKTPMSKIIEVIYDCEKCGVKCVTTNHNLRYRKHHKNEYICQKCLIKLEKSSSVFDALPNEFHNQVFDNQIDFDVAVKYLYGISTHINVRFACKKCQQIIVMRWNNLLRRKHHRLDNICIKCLNDLIQNDPYKLKSNSDKSKLLWNNNDYKLKCLKAFEAHNKRMQLDTTYANKHRRRSKSITGTILLNNQNIVFDSAFELIFLAITRNSFAKIRRCNFAIAYNNHFYHPDFFVVYHDGTSSIIEIKGFYNNNVSEKQQAAESYIKETGVTESYVLYDTTKLLADGILLGTGGAKMWKQIRDFYDETIITFTDPKHKRIAEIGLSRYRKETKNKQNI